MISFESVSKEYAGRAAVSDFSLRIGRGERVVLLGPSGCGKTTVLRLLAGLTAPAAGRILIGDREVSGPGKLWLPPEERNLGFVFQDLALWPHMTVRGNLEFGLKARGIARPEREKRIRAMLALAELSPRADARPGELSGGEQQRVALARALIVHPETLLMDEPLSSLNPELNLRLRQDILRLHRELSFTLLYVTHNREEAHCLGTRLVLMNQGRIERIEPA
ncbi:MAG: ABC transporter ATP-binding protein [Acidobacteria bacterium]|nr:ABC transporter ATP-binding protein [Acidobacteriota bacterium]